MRNSASTVRPTWVLNQYPSSLGGIADHAALAKEVQDAGGKVVVAADPMALVMLEAPGHWGADIVVGSMQRFWCTDGLWWSARCIHGCFGCV